MRAFVAIDLSEEARRALSALINELKSLGLRATFPKTEALHITLAFLGEVPEARIQEIVECLKGIECRAFCFEISGIGFFPALRAARVIWAGVGNGADHLCALQQQVALRIGYREPRPWVPHIALARLKERVPTEVLRRFQQKYSMAIAQSCAKSIVLKKSTLTREGPVYEDLASIELR